ncbi:hypothetical protein B7988_14535 [Fibrobacter sp. UWB1]|uniref:P-loop NTPase fold protein n=1 Tax=Fibrobacter sp. UWB1 TaxID=1964355 RepID=UPI000B5250A9|nr:P-loop NTPase fold protein [Fibrobacter sp. UWB1]OWV23487.1 hypothetical protein B7988_14535 [Fibrobacter sp. UWB1]
MNNNQHIREFLDFYLGRPESKLKCMNTDYAVLITGYWGSGKTHFIRNYLGKDDSEIRNWFTDCKDYCVVYVTLFGVKTREEINQRVFQKICPVLSSEKLENLVGNIPNLAELAGFVVGLVAGTPTIAVASKKYSKIVGNQLKELSQKVVDDLKKTKKEFKKTIIIFDDVERADVPIPELLGYINEYVEHLKIPCILLAEENIWNEAKIKQKNDSTLHSLSSTEEKVVGKRFLIQTTPEEIINAWFPDDVVAENSVDENDKVCPPSHIFGDNVHELLFPHKNMLINIIKASGVNNYRAFKHTLHDLNNFIGFGYCNIPKKYFEKDKDFGKYLLADFLCIQYAKYLDLLKKDFYEIDSHKSTENDGSYKDFKNQFENIDRITSLNYLGDEYKWLPLWKKWLRNGSIDKDEIESKIKDTIWFDRKQDDMLPKLYDWYKLSDVEGEKALLYFKEILDEKKLLDPDAIFSLYYKFYWYAEKGALEETPDEFNKKMNEYLDSIKDNIHYQDFSSFGGMDSYEFMTEAFEKNVSEFRDKLKKIVLARKEFHNVDETNYFNAQMKSENDLTFNLLCKKVENRNSYNLEKIKEKDFVESFVSLKTMERKNRFKAALEGNVYFLSQIPLRG